MGQTKKKWLSFGDNYLIFKVTRGLRISNFAKKGLSAPSRLQQCSDQGLLARNIKCLSKHPISNPCSLSCLMFMALQQYFSHKPIPIVCHSIPRTVRAFHILPWNSVAYDENLWNFIEFRGLPWPSMTLHGMEFHVIMPRKTLPFQLISV